MIAANDGTTFDDALRAELIEFAGSHSGRMEAKVPGFRAAYLFRRLPEDPKLPRSVGCVTYTLGGRLSVRTPRRNRKCFFSNDGYCKPNLTRLGCHREMDHPANEAIQHAKKEAVRHDAERRSH